MRTIKGDNKQVDPIKTITQDNLLILIARWQKKADPNWQYELGIVVCSQTVSFRKPCDKDKVTLDSPQYYKFDKTTFNLH